MRKFLLAAIPLALMAGCSDSRDGEVLHQSGIEQYVATVVATEGHDVSGTVTFTRRGSEVEVVAHIEGLDPNGVHGFHIHQYGDCTSPDALSAGGHFNPTSSRHGGPHDDERHVGDLGNLEANDEGMAHSEFLDSKLTMDGNHSILGRSVVIHADPDDFETQPTGDAGGRIGCGVIGVSERN